TSIFFIVHPGRFQSSIWSLFGSFSRLRGNRGGRKKYRESHPDLEQRRRGKDDDQRPPRPAHPARTSPSPARQRRTVAPTLARVRLAILRMSSPVPSPVSALASGEDEGEVCPEIGRRRQPARETLLVGPAPSVIRPSTRSTSRNRLPEW